MQVHTSYVGYVVVDPPLNEMEGDYLDAFVMSRRWDRPAGPYAVPQPVLASERFSRVRGNRPAPGQPSLWCPLAPSLDGTRLACDELDDPGPLAPWLRYLVEHFLAPGAAASRSAGSAKQTRGASHFDDFTFDHEVYGTIVGCDMRSGRLYAVEAQGRTVVERTLLGPVPGPSWAELPEAEREALSDQAITDPAVLTAPAHALTDLGRRLAAVEESGMAAHEPEPHGGRRLVPEPRPRSDTRPARTQPLADVIPLRPRSSTAT